MHEADPTADVERGADSQNNQKRQAPIASTVVCHALQVQGPVGGHDGRAVALACFDRESQTKQGDRRCSARTKGWQCMQPYQ